MRRQAGFTYLGLLILVAIIGLVGAASLKVGSLLQRAAAEEELLEIGAEYSRALKSYADATPRGLPRFPATMQELLRDPRFPGVRRHLRRIYVDPITGKAEWGLVKVGETGVLGVYSLSESAPLKVANFDARFTGFENKKKISEWRFMATGQSMIPVAARNATQPTLFNPQPAGEPAKVTVTANDRRAEPSAAEPEAPPREQPAPEEKPEPAEAARNDATDKDEPKEEGEKKEGEKDAPPAPTGSPA